jgi:hypothetical protein
MGIILLIFLWYFGSVFGQIVYNSDNIVQQQYQPTASRDIRSIFPEANYQPSTDDSPSPSHPRLHRNPVVNYPSGQQYSVVNYPSPQPSPNWEPHHKRHVNYSPAPSHSSVNYHASYDASAVNYSPGNHHTFPVNNPDLNHETHSTSYSALSSSHGMYPSVIKRAATYSSPQQYQPIPYQQLTDYYQNIRPNREIPQFIPTPLSYGMYPVTKRDVPYVPVPSQQNTYQPIDYQQPSDYYQNIRPNRQIPQFCYSPAINPPPVQHQGYNIYKVKVPRCGPKIRAGIPYPIMYHGNNGIPVCGNNGNIGIPVNVQQPAIQYQPVAPPVFYKQKVKHPHYKPVTRFVNVPSTIPYPTPISVPYQPINVPYQPVNVPYQPVNVPYQPLGVPCQPVGVPCQPVGVPCQPVSVPYQPVTPDNIPCQTETLPCNNQQVITYTNPPCNTIHQVVTPRNQITPRKYCRPHAKKILPTTPRTVYVVCQPSTTTPPTTTTIKTIDVSF